jgi:hypothetical protein
VLQEIVMSLKSIGVIEIPDSIETSFDHGALDPKSRRVFVAHTARNRVEVIDHDSSRHLATLYGFPKAAGIVADEGHILVTNRGAASLAWIDAHTLKTQAVFDTGPRPNGVGRNTLGRIPSRTIDTRYADQFGRCLGCAGRITAIPGKLGGRGSLFIRSVEADAAADGTPETAALLERLLAYKGVQSAVKALAAELAITPVLPMHFRKGETTLRLFTTIATLGTPCGQKIKTAGKTRGYPIPA